MSLEGEQGLVSGPATSGDTNANTEDNNAFSGFSSPDDQGSADLPATSDEQDGELDNGQNEPDPWEGYEDYEFNGVVKKIPSEWKENMMLKADHTRRLQEDAERRKEFQAREVELQQRFQQTEDEFKAHVELANVQAQLKQAEGINWSQEYNRLLNDPRQNSDYIAWDLDVKKFNALQMQFRDLKEREAALQQTTKDFAGKRIEFGEQDTAKRLSATLEFARTIKGWTPDLDAKITQFATNDLGYDVETLKRAYSPQIYKTLHLAYLGQQSQQRQQTAKPASQAAPTPTQTVTTKANVSRGFDPEKSSMEDYAKDYAARQSRKR